MNGQRMVTAALALVCATPLTAQNTVTVAQRSAPAVVTLKVYDGSGTAIGQGSGFFVDDGRIVTNTHVVEGAARVDVFGSDEQLLGSVPYVEALSDAVDIAILPRLGAAPPASLALDDALPKAGVDIIVIGAPLGLSNTVSTGIVSAVRSGSGPARIQITAPISPGSSGGPVLNSAGDVIGVAVAMRMDGQAINFSVPARDVVALLGSPAGRLAFPAVSSGNSHTSDRASAQPRHIAVGDTVTDTLTRSDPSLDNGEYYHAWQFEGSANDQLVVTLTSGEFDSYVAIVSPDIDWEVEDDDGAGDTNAKLVATLPATGDYLIIATSFEGGETGKYSLSVAPLTEESAANEWVRYGGTTDQTELFYLPSTIRILGDDTYDVWTRWIYASPQESHSGEEYDSERRLVRVDCEARQLGLVSWAEYGGNSLIDAQTVRDVDMRAAIPETVGDALVGTICLRITPGA